MSDTKAKELGLTPLARVVVDRRLGPVAGDHGPRPGRGLAPGARPRRHDDRRHRPVEINEAFAAQVLPRADDLGMDFDKLNVHGGAIALGHPFGVDRRPHHHARCSTACSSRDGQFGLETMCVGGGQGMAIIFERLS